MSRAVLISVAVFACTSIVPAEVVIETVTVGNPGNAGEWSGECAPGGFGPCRVCGAVDYVYYIGKFEVTAAQYAEFLNAVAAEDTYGLYNEEMDVGLYPDDLGCNIVSTGSSPNFSYSVAPEWADRPVNHVSWGDAARFANWLYNGQPTGAQDITTTEDGSYNLSATHEYYGPNGQIEDFFGLRIALLAVVREPDATWVIPSEDEWYKAAYHYNNGVTGDYYNYPTRSDVIPEPEACPGGSNSANYYWDGHPVGPPYYRAEVGCYVSSDGPYGTFDQGGNVSEWSEEIIAVQYRLHPGGSFWVGDEQHAARRHACCVPESEGGATGFRVANKVACGNGTIEDSEECDDGNSEPDDGCDEICRIELGACCVGTACDVMTESGCSDSGGTLYGFNTTCDAPDADGDALRDECDGCPNDGNKFEPGICGCGLDDSADADADSFPDDCDACPQSDLAKLIVINECETSVLNTLLENGCTMMDVMAECTFAAHDHGAMTACVAQHAKEWKRRGLITGKEFGRITRCIATSNQIQRSKRGVHRRTSR